MPRVKQICICKGFFRDPVCPIHGQQKTVEFEETLRKGFNTAKKDFGTVRQVKNKLPTSLSDLPDDVNIHFFRINGMWQIALYCSVLNVCLGHSDREPKIIDAIKSVLEQYAKNKGIS